MTTTMDQTTDAVQQLNSLLRGEIAAAETYRMAISKISDDQRNTAAANVGLLQSIQEEHARAAATLRDRIEELGGQPADSSGSWGAWAQAVQGTMNLFGDAAALKSLKEGEEHGAKDYKSALKVLDAASQQLVQNQLLPAQQRHVQVLTQLIKGLHEPAYTDCT